MGMTGSPPGEFSLIPPGTKIPGQVTADQLRGRAVRADDNIMTGVAAWIDPHEPNKLHCWCEGCASWHHHGRGSAPETAENFGHRQSHCRFRALLAKPDPGFASGYTLVNFGTADEAVLKAMRRRQPPPDFERRACSVLNCLLDRINLELDQLRHERVSSRRGVTEFVLDLY
jgi:hypothetical protein